MTNKHSNPAWQGFLVYRKPDGSLEECPVLDPYPISNGNECLNATFTLGRILGAYGCTARKVEVPR